MTRCGMHGTSTGIERYVVAHDRRNVETKERVFEAQQFEVRAFTFAQYSPFCDTGAFHDAFNQIGCQDQTLTFCLNQLIRKLRVQ
ncbi:hypothetical protein SRABI106_01072 [Rahnella aquatilis]|nr:hypothetical protein SRABI106_01072 [Rahnella aquatilis]